MVARLEQEGLDLNRLIDDELEEVGFLALCSRYNNKLQWLIIKNFRLKIC